MHIISVKTLKEYWYTHPEVEGPLKAWVAVAKKAAWKTTNDIQTRYPSADFLKDNRVVFNIKGNHYRLVVRINYPAKSIYIRFVGTHAEYSKIDAEII